MGECKQCGECCKILVFPLPPYISPDLIRYYNIHGCIVDQVTRRLIIPARCKHLTEDNKCDIQATKPDVCKNYIGQSTGYYVPENCGYRKENKI